MSPALADVPIYNIAIISALVVALPQICSRISPHRLAGDPISLCVLGLLPAVLASHLCRFDMYRARAAALEFGKSIIYYMVLISVVNSTDRLRKFMYAVALCAACNQVIAVLHYYEIIQVPSLTTLQQATRDEKTGEVSTVARLRATGIFN